MNEITPTTRSTVEPDTVEQTVRIAARPETVWTYWTDAERMCDWWGTAAELDPRPGGTYCVEMAGGLVMRGEFVELAPFDRLVFSFGWEPSDGLPELSPGASRVEVTLVEDGGDTILTLRHSGLPGALAELHATGWSQFLPNLVTAADRATA